MAKEESKLEKLKENYKVIEKRYDLPSFEKLNEDFQIEKAAEMETDILIREVRKFMADKLAGYMRFVETLINPVNAPMFVFSIIKSLGPEEKKKATEIYKKLAKNEIKLIEIDTDFSEKTEAEFIRNSYELWKGIKRDILYITERINKNWDNKFEVGTRGYFG